MTIKQIEPLLQQRFHNEVWVFSPDGELALDVIDLDPRITYQPTIDRNRLKLEHLKTLPHKITIISPCADKDDLHAKLQIAVRLGKGLWWNV